MILATITITHEVDENGTTTDLTVEGDLSLVTALGLLRIAEDSLITTPELLEGNTDEPAS